MKHTYTHIYILKKNLQDEGLGCLFLKVRTGAKLWTGRLAETGERTGTSNSLTRRYTGIISCLIIQKLFFYVIKFVFSIHKDSKNKCREKISK